MGLKDDLSVYVKDIFDKNWTERSGQVVPTENSVTMSNDAVKVTGAVLYADLADSTKLVDAFAPQFAAEIYKTFLHCAAKIIASEGGQITAYDGDRVMAVFLGDHKETLATRAGLKIYYAIHEIIKPALANRYISNYDLQHVVGIDASELFVAKTGVRGANDLVWVGRAANHAAKMAALPHEHHTYISADVYNLLHDSVKFWENGNPVWEPVAWTSMGGRIIYRSNCWYTFF